MMRFGRPAAALVLAAVLAVPSVVPASEPSAAPTSHTFHVFAHGQELSPPFEFTIAPSQTGPDTLLLNGLHYEPMPSASEIPPAPIHETSPDPRYAEGAQLSAAASELVAAAGDKQEAETRILALYRESQLVEHVEPTESGLRVLFHGDEGYVSIIYFGPLSPFAAGCNDTSESSVLQILQDGFWRMSEHPRTSVVAFGNGYRGVATGETAHSLLAAVSRVPEEPSEKSQRLIDVVGGDRFLRDVERAQVEEDQ